MMGLIDQELFRDMARHDEGARLLVYDDATGKTIGPGTTVIGNPTIGIGRNVGPGGPGLRDVEMNLMLVNDAAHYSEQAGVFDWFHDLDEIRATVVVTMIFNMGFRNFCTFKNTIAHIAAGEYAQAADNMLQSLWAKQVGDRAVRLSEMMRHGVKITR